MMPPLEVSLMAGGDGDMGWKGVGNSTATLGSDRGSQWRPMVTEGCNEAWQHMVAVEA